MWKLCVVTVLAFSGTAHASEWVRTIQTADGSTFYIDKASIAGTKAQRQVWVKFDHSTKRKPLPTADSPAVAELRKRGLLAEGGNIRLVPLRDPLEDAVETKQLWLFRCPDNATAIASSITYGAQGAVLKAVHERPSTRDFTVIVPDSLGESVREWVCG